MLDPAGGGLFGRAGNDVLNGHGGGDIDFGGLGVDAFAIGAGDDAGRVGDVIPGEDVPRRMDPLAPDGSPIAAFGDRWSGCWRRAGIGRRRWS